jgi:DNA ligase-1
MKITELFNSIKNESSTLGKKQLIKDNLSNVLKQIFIDTYDKNKKYYIKNIPELTTYGDLTIDDEYDTFHSTLMKLHYRDVTGNDAVEFLTKTLEHYTKDDQEILVNIVQRNLKVGVSIENFNAVCPVVSTFDVALAENLEKAKNVDPIDGTYFASQKLDGARCICFVNKKTVGGDCEYEIEFKSRQGKTFTTLDNLKPHVIDLFTFHRDGNYVVDGECCMIMEDGSESFKGIMKEITRKNHTIENPCYKVFDLLTLEEFNMEVESRLFSERLKELVDDWYSSGVNAKFIDVIEQERIETQEDFDKWSQRVKEKGWEGFMLRKDVPYKSGRSKDLLKVKKFLDDEYVVKDVVMGKATYNEGGHKEFDIASALVIEHKGNRVEVGSGLSKEQRIRWNSHPDEIIGKTITVQYFEETTNKQGGISLRFPVLKYVYEHGREV